jgi:hypothetical protein
MCDFALAKSIVQRDKNLAFLRHPLLILGRAATSGLFFWSFRAQIEPRRSAAVP